MASGHDHHGVVQLARRAQRIQHAADLRINISRRAAVAAREVWLRTVQRRRAVKRNPREPAVIFLRIALQPVYPLAGGLRVTLRLRGWQ